MSEQGTKDNLGKPPQYLSVQKRVWKEKKIGTGGRQLEAYILEAGINRK